MNFDLLGSIMTSTHYPFRENAGFPSKENRSTFSFASLTYDSIWRMKSFFGTSIGLSMYTFFFLEQKNQFEFFRSESGPRFDQLVGLPLIFWTKKSLRLPAQKMVRVTYHLEKWTWSVQFVYGKNSKTSGRCKWYAFRTIVRDPSLLLDRVTLLNRNFTLGSLF